jgi:AraC-like DNA-binding protein
MSSLVRAACLTQYGEVARAAGLDPSRMLTAAGLSLDVLTDLDLKIPAERVGQLLEASAAASGVETFGLRMAQSRELSNLGPVGLVMRDQLTLRGSLDVLVRYQVLLNASLSLMIEEAAGVVIIREEVIVGHAQPVRQSIELALGVLMRLLRRFLGADWRPQRVCFTHAAPRDKVMHHRVFGPRVQFDAEFNGIVCARADLDVRNPSADPVMARYAQQLLDASVEPHATTMLEDLRRTILALLPSGHCSVEQACETLGVPPRTVQRRLAEQGESFSSLVNGVRVELARRHVGEGDRPLIEVAALLGFSAPSGFSRWYRSQFGCSPKEKRATRARARA